MFAVPLFLVTLPTAAPLTACGLIAGAVSMWLYQRVSPQDRLNQLVAELEESRQAMQAYEGDFDGMLELSKQNMWLSLKRVGYALGPSLIAGVPVIAAFAWLGSTAWATGEAMPFGPDWVRSWITLFIVATTISALAIKWAFKIR
ncbi:MAG: hypothetical protein KDA58_11430 [Planctomycetaceae bacterium]|nr:hypothetical protein [Planctomycetaceae bacterium]